MNKERRIKENMIGTIALYEIKSASRNQTFLITSLVLLLLLIVALFCGYENYKKGFQQREAAQKVINEEWQHQTRNPHAAAHWGTYLFKPYPFISLYETGLTHYTGNYYRVEAHKQRPVNAIVFDDKEAFMRIPDLSLAFIFQVLMPLLIIFQAFACVTKERENQTLRLLYVQGITRGQLLWGKLWGNYLVVLCTLSVTFFVMFIGLLFDAEKASQSGRLFGLFFVYATYLFITTAGVVLNSFYCRSSSSSLITSVSVWVFLILLLPRLSTSIADRIYPLPSAYKFEHDVKVGFNKGLGNDGNYIERSKAYLSTFLEQYGVDSISQLRENVAFGLDLLNSEQYSNKVYRHFSAQIEEKIANQQHFLDIVALVNPLMATRQLSMGLAGTDFYHHVDFYKNAQSYRNEFNEILNQKVLEQKDHQSLVEKSNFFKNMKKFNYQYPNLLWSIKCHIWAVASLILWLSLFVYIYTSVVNTKFGRV